MERILVNGKVLTPTGFVINKAVTLAGERIQAVVEDTPESRANRDIHDLGGQYLLPGFIDVQVNGGGGVLFNDAPSVDTIRTIGAAHRRFGTTGFLPTLISDDLDVVAAAMEAATTAIAERVPGVLGIHLEGPFINVAKKGVHAAAKLRRLDRAAVELLRQPTGGTTVVTLAPELAEPALIRALVEAGVIVSAGHTNATYAEARIGLDQGITGFTHLFNAMSPMTSREPGAVGAALDDPDSWCGVIVDGYHVDPVMLRLALRAKGRNRFMLVTDAMPSVGAAEKSFVLQGRRITVENHRCIDADGRLAGSDIDMAMAVQNARTMLQVDLAEAAHMASAHPAQFLGLNGQFGYIAPGYRADLTLVDPQINVLETWIGGQPTQQ